MLTQDDHKRIAEAIGRAESKSAGEVFCVLAHEVSHYREVPLAWAAIAAFVVPPLLVLTILNWPGGMDLFSTWSAGGPAGALGWDIRAVSAYGLLQAGLFTIVALVVSQPAVRRRLTPRFLKRGHVRQAARSHFTASGARLSDAEPHILIFASLKERQVELVAHEAIHRAVGDGPWNATVAAVGAGMKAGKPADGFVRAIEICGAALAEHFPSQGPPVNRLPNDILER